MAPTDEEDGAPRRGEQDTPGSIKSFGEEYSEGPARAGPHGVELAGP